MAIEPALRRCSIWVPIFLPLLLLPVGRFLNGPAGWIAITTLSALCAAWATAAVRKLAVLKLGKGAKRESCFNRYAYLGAIAAVGVGPIIVQSMSTTIAIALGCYVNEHGAYTHGQLFDSIGCKWEGFELGAILHFLYMSALLLIVTWPFTIATIVILLAQLSDLIRSRDSRAGQEHPGKGGRA